MNCLKEYSNSQGAGPIRFNYLRERPVEHIPERKDYELVYISKIVVRNFKSFSGNIKLNFSQGFNIITGPNGSGKSNIIDAVQFVFGELGSKRMRVTELSGVIFDGAGEDGSKPQYAQVNIYFDNSDRGLALDRKTISIGRRIDRQGKSKYFLNGKRTSRRRLMDLLDMAGISSNGYNMVLQGTATRLSDITPGERMTALEDLVGITEYDEKKAEARVRLNEAERKIEVASAKSDEVRKRVNELERQRNDALRHKLLTGYENRLEAYKLSYEVNRLESKILELREQIDGNKADVQKLEEEKTGLLKERDEARERLEQFTNEAAEKGNTQLPILKSNLVEKQALKNSQVNRIQEIESQKKSLQSSIERKLEEIQRSKTEIEEKRLTLETLSKSEKEVSRTIGSKERQLEGLSEKSSALKESAETNQLRVEKLTEDLVPMQESLSGLEIGINRHHVNANSLEAKVQELKQKKTDSLKTSETLEKKIEELEVLKVQEAKKLEDMLENVDDQVKRQKNLRNTIEGANKLAKDAELTITEFTAKRDLWKSVVAEEKAQARIIEMGEAGALEGYHGPLRSLVKIDLKYQKAARTAANGWINAIIVDDIETALRCIESLKKTKLGMTRFLPLNDISPPESPPQVDSRGVLGLIPRLIRYDERYKAAVNLIWGDTFVVDDRNTAIDLTRKGFRSVTLDGDLFEVKGGLLGGHWRRPPDYTKLIPREESITELSTTIRSLRKRLTTRMKDLSLSGGSLREFTRFMDDFNKNIDGIDDQILETQESIKRLERSITTIDENISKHRENRERELSLASALEERRGKTLQEIERAKSEIAKLKELSPSDIASLEVTQDGLEKEVVQLREERAQLRSDISVQTSLIDKYLELKTSDSESQIERWREEITHFETERLEGQKRLEAEIAEITELEKGLSSVISEVEATSRVLEGHRRSVSRIERQSESNDRKQVNIHRRSMELDVEVEKVRLQTEQRFQELARLGFEDIVSIDSIDLNRIEFIHQRVRRERASLRAINQLAVELYESVVINYKYLSIRINDLEEERGSILKFIDEVEQEKQEHFMKAFNEVCENFSVFFAKLTGGGDGRLELHKPENPFSGGVDLYVQFPGKPMRLVGGASGGERSVSTIAYLLAIQRFLKAPFYLFDEIDAHLDDLNIARLADVLKEASLEAQFLMVSLKDVMVHNADRIYGVFAQKGRSKVLALPMKVEVAM